MYTRVKRTVELHARDGLLLIYAENRPITIVHMHPTPARVR